MQVDVMGIGVDLFIVFCQNGFCIVQQDFWVFDDFQLIFVVNGSI